MEVIEENEEITETTMETSETTVNKHTEQPKKKKMGSILMRR
jgi:hypothetical protein